MNILIILVIVVLIGLIGLGYVYNSLIQHRNFVKEGWSGIDVQLKKRYDLIPNIVESVKEYAIHEQAVFAEVTKVRANAIGANSVTEQGFAENAISGVLGKLMIVAENYPDLKANTTFLDLQKQLEEVENDISLARRYYNGTVRNNNIAVESFPTNIVASLFGFDSKDYFEIEESERIVPKTFS